MLLSLSLRQTNIHLTLRSQGLRPRKRARLLSVLVTLCVALALGMTDVVGVGHRVGRVSRSMTSRSPSVTGRGLGGAGLLRLAWRVWVLDFTQRRFHSVSPGNCESVFIKVGSVRQEGLGWVEAATGSAGCCLGRAVLSTLESRKEVSYAGLREFPRKYQSQGQQ